MDLINVFNVKQVEVLKIYLHKKEFANANQDTWKTSKNNAKN
jgi:hypothetical protein